MPVADDCIEKVLKRKNREGNPQLIAGPVASPPGGLPEWWAEVLKETDPRRIVATRLWAPLEKLLPRTISALQSKLHGVGLLKTDQHPMTLVYFFRGNGKCFAFRGWPPGMAERPEAAKVPAEFLPFYKVHNGWNDMFGGETMGPLRSQDWYMLADVVDDADARARAEKDLDPDSFPVVFDNGGGAHLGFDLSKTPPPALIWWADGDPTNSVPNLWEALDAWMSGDFENLDDAP